MLTQQVRCRRQQGLQQSEPGLQGLSWRLMQSFLLEQRALGLPCYPVLPQGTAVRLRTFESMSGKGMHNVPPVNALDLCCKACNRGMGRNNIQVQLPCGDYHRTISNNSTS